MLSALDSTDVGQSSPGVLLDAPALAPVNPSPRSIGMTAPTKAIVMTLDGLKPVRPMPNWVLLKNPPTRAATVVPARCRQSGHTPPQGLTREPASAAAEQNPGEYAQMPPPLCEGSRGVAFLANGRRHNKARPMPATSRIRTTAQGKWVAQLSVMLTRIPPERRARRIRWRCGSSVGLHGPDLCRSRQRRRRRG